MQEWAPAKINLFLHVLGKRTDGYHTLQSLMIFTPTIADIISVQESEITEVRITGPYAAGLMADDTNLVMRAAKVLQAVAGPQKPVLLTLEKHLPVASGIGGGSADAAAAMRLLMRWWQIELPEEQIYNMAVRLGSDVPACIRSQPVFVEGVGEQLTPVALPCALAMVLVNPAVPLSTAEVFGHISPQDRSSCIMPQCDTVDELVSWLHTTTNDLESAATQIVPEINDVLTALNDQAGCRLARMSGSGATCFGIFSSPADAAQAVIAIKKIQPKWWVQST